MLGNNYIKIDGVAVPNPRKYEVGYSTTETVKTSEAGTEVVIPTRYNKRTITLSFQVSSFWKDKLLAFTAKPTVTFTMKNEAIRGRLRAEKAPLKAGSEYLEKTEGLWTLSLKFIEQ